jgi:3-oxoacyl-[acyl-carrier-protein] synthase II
VGKDIVISGVGMITPLGDSAADVWDAVMTRKSAATSPAFAARDFACPLCATITGRPPDTLVPDTRMIRFMNRDAMLAVIAARRAMQDAQVEIGCHYQPEEVALVTATGLAGIALEEVSRMVANAAGEDGQFDLRRFGSVALRQVRPVLSFKILSNMPACFVSLSEGIQGFNAVYTPWEGQGAQAIITAIRAIEHGDAACALVGGCDVKAHVLGFIALEQQGVFESWKRAKVGTIPSEGACFLVLEERAHALARGVPIYARVADWALGTVIDEEDRAEAAADILAQVKGECFDAIVAGGDEDVVLAEVERKVLAPATSRGDTLHPKKYIGNLFAAAAATQVALGATWARRRAGRVLATCFGHGSQQAAFVLEAV